MRRRAASAYVIDVACPTCKSAKGERCRALTSRRTTDTHEARVSAWWRLPRNREMTP